MAVQLLVARFVSLLGVMMITSPCIAAETKWIDLSYSFIENETIYWPGMKPYTHKQVFYGELPGRGIFVTYSEFAAGEHGGTHMDAPVHFNRNGKTLEKVPVESMIGDAIVVNMSAKADKDPDAQLTVSDLEAWEEKHGRIPDKSIVLLYTGFGRYWPDKNKYFGSNDTTNSSTFHFPGIHSDAAKWLINNRKIKLYGVDAVSLDYGQNKDYATHVVFLGANIPGIENVANLHLLPPRGAEVIAAPMKIKGGSGGPCRMFARIADKTTISGGTRLNPVKCLVALIIMICVLF